MKDDGEVATDDLIFLHCKAQNGRVSTKALIWCTHDSACSKAHVPACASVAVGSINMREVQAWQVWVLPVNGMAENNMSLSLVSM
mmetsp:Transcript_69479/g.192278  ORF Transcript_69479/g.192278 Transcript_69479/m.192278 type:complete len:85 (+) Transcript_69479:267-521(+)